MQSILFYNILSSSNKQEAMGKISPVLPIVKQIQYFQNAVAFFKAELIFKKVWMHFFIEASSVGEVNIAKFIFKMLFYAVLKWEVLQYGCSY